MKKELLVSSLNEYLQIAKFKDVSNNGLQVDSGCEEVTKVCLGVDATLPLFERAAEMGAEFVICHHGISWGDSLSRIVGVNYKQVKFLLDHNIALWACHLPMDAHGEVGNNIGICRALGLTDIVPFGKYHGETIGFSGKLSNPMTREEFVTMLKGSISSSVVSHSCGKEVISTVGVVSGGASEMVSDAIDCGLDAYITGETNLQSYNLCLQAEMNMFALGHYATERFGVKAIGEWLKAKFNLSSVFVDFDLPY